LLVVTFDENAGGTAKPIPTIIVGANVRPVSIPSGSTTTSCFAPSRTSMDCPRLAAPKPHPHCRRFGRARRFGEAVATAAERLVLRQ
jgi:hypothetical protein